MSKVKMKFNELSEIAPLTEIALKNGYKVTLVPIFELYWKTKIDHFEVTLEKLEQLKEQS